MRRGPLDGPLDGPIGGPVAGSFDRHLARLGTGWPAMAPRTFSVVRDLLQ